jgi:hypothetical protein
MRHSLENPPQVPLHGAVDNKSIKNVRVAEQ